MKNVFDELKKIVDEKVIRPIELHPEWHTAEAVVYPVVDIPLVTVLKSLGAIFPGQTEKMTVAESGGISIADPLDNIIGARSLAESKYPKAIHFKTFIGEFGVVVTCFDVQWNHIGDIVTKWEDIKKQEPAKPEAKPEAKPVKTEAEEKPKRKFSFGKKPEAKKS